MFRDIRKIMNSLGLKYGNELYREEQKRMTLGS